MSAPTPPTPARRTLRRVAAPITLSLVAFVGCDGPDTPPTIGEWQAPVTLETVARARCDTPPELVDGLSRQLVDAINCLRPGTLARFPLGDDIRLLRDGRPDYIDARALDALVAAAADGDRQMVVRWAYRDVALQHLFWLQDQFQGCAVAAPAGLSNHQNGLAVDLNDFQAWEPVMRRNGWGNDLPNDRVHFDYQRVPDIGLGALSLLAFQVLWNENNPDEELALSAELDGDTYDALSRAPIEGFPIELCDGAPPPVGPGPVRGPTVGQQAWRGCGAPAELVEGIAEQVARGMACLEPEALRPVPICAQPGCVEIAAPPALEWLGGPALDALEAASGELGEPIVIEEALRDVTLRHFYDSTADNIGCTPPNGRADLITGRALRLDADGAIADALEAAGFEDGGRDIWRFSGAGAADLDTLSTLAFQQLWNLNRPDESIDDDGLIGPQTRAAIDRAPIAGFPRSLCEVDPPADMGPPPPDAEPPPVDADVVEDAGEIPLDAGAEVDAGPTPDATPERDAMVSSDAGRNPDTGEPDPRRDATPIDPDGGVTLPPAPVPGWSGLEEGDVGCEQAPSGPGSVFLLCLGVLALRRRR